MNNAKLRTVPAGLVLLAVSGSAFAQGTTGSQPPPGQAPGQPPAQTAQAPYGTEAGGQAQMGGHTQVGMGLPGAGPPPYEHAAAAPMEHQPPPLPGATDHDGVVGRLAVGYLGRTDIQVGVTGQGGVSLAAPVIGVRYWLDPGLGLDLGLGLAIQGGSTEVNGDETDAPSFWGLILHGGVPLALAAGRHYVFEIIPEANVGFGSGSGEDVDHSGFQLDLGARAGAEVHFGFIGIPELSLQASVGVLFGLQNASTMQDEGAADESEVKQSSYAFRTSVQNSPWNIFTSNVAAFYYF